MDFIVDQSRQSYRDAFASSTAVTYMDAYMSQFGTNMAVLFEAGGKGFSYAGLDLPALGHPHVDSAWGVNAAIGFYEKDDEALGLKVVDDGSAAGIDLSFFRTLSSERVSDKLGRGFWENSDMTFMLNNSDIRGWGDVRMHFSNLGFLLRKQVVRERSCLRGLVKLQGATVSSGAYYSRMTGREDEMGHSFHQYSTNPEDRDIVVADPSTGGTVAISSPSTILEEDMGLIYYPYIEFTTLSLRSEATAYFSLFRLVDLFSGVRLALVPYSSYYADIAMDVKARISDDSGLDETHLGQLTAIGMERGDPLVGHLFFGLQLNLGPLKIPWQVSVVPGYQAGSFGLVLSL